MGVRGKGDYERPLRVGAHRSRPPAAFCLLCRRGQSRTPRRAKSLALFPKFLWMRVYKIRYLKFVEICDIKIKITDFLILRKSVIEIEILTPEVITMGFGARAKMLVTDRDVTQKKLAKHIGITPAKMSNYLTEKNEMPCRVIVGIADYFHVSTDYLLGLTNEPEPPMHISKEEKALVETYRSLSREQRELISQTIRLMGEQNNRREG